MPGVFPRRPAAASLVVAMGLAMTAAALPSLLLAQEPADQPALPASPDASPAAGMDGSPVLSPYAPSNNAGSGLLPANPPLPPHPSVPDPSLLPASTPSPSATPFPLPFPSQSDTPLPSTANGAAGTTPATGGTTTTSVTDAARRFQYAFRLSTGVNYDDNVFLTSNGSAPGTNSVRRGTFRRDVYFSIDPSVSLGYGDFLSRATNFVEFDYTADALIYVRNTDQDTVQHSFNLQGAYHFGQFTLSLSQSIQLLSSTDLSANSSGSLLGSGGTGTANAPNAQVNLDTSRRTTVDVFGTRVDLNSALTDKTSIDLDGIFSASEYETLISSDAFAADLFLNYSPAGKITLGLGATGGYVIQSDPAPNEFYQQINLRLTYLVTSKLNVLGSGGVEFRETSGVDQTAVSPIFDLTITYSPFDSTAVSLLASRHVQTSAVLIGQNFDSTGFSISASQRFFQKGYLRLSVGYTYSNYTNTGSNRTSTDRTDTGRMSTDRTDHYYFVQPSFDFNVRDNLSVGVFYTHRQNFSSASGNGFEDNQVGARVSFSF